MGTGVHDMGTFKQDSSTDYSIAWSVNDIRDNILQKQTGGCTGSKITKITFDLTTNVTTDWGYATVTTYVAFSNGTASNATNSGNSVRIDSFSYRTDQNATQTKSYDLTKYFNSTHPYSASSDTNGYQYFWIYFDTTSWNTKYWRINRAVMTVTYDDNHTISIDVTPSGTGTTTGQGTYEHGTNVTIAAYPIPGYVFSHWLKNGVKVEDSQASMSIGSVTEDKSYTAVFTPGQYTITWKNIDGNQGTQTSIAHGGTTPSCPYSVNKAPDKNKHYLSYTWEPAITTVTGNAEYTAIFSEENHTFSTYEVQPPSKYEQGYIRHACQKCSYFYDTDHVWWHTFLDGDGSQLYIDKVKTGDIPNCPHIPTKKSDNEKVYRWIFNTSEPWEPPLTAASSATGNITHSPNFIKEAIKYKITFLHMDETVNETQELEYGSLITPPPYRNEDTSVEYAIFKGWQNSITNEWLYNDTLVSGDVTYVARYEWEPKEFKVTWWKDEVGGEELYSGYFKYKTIPEYPYDDPIKESENEEDFKYVFNGWYDPKSDSMTEDDQDLPIVMGDTDYIAQFVIEKILYYIRWVNASEQVGVEGKELYNETIYYGETPRFDISKCNPPITELKHPKQGIDPKYTYQFAGWSTKVGGPPIEDEYLDFEGSITYTAVYLPILINYYITVYRYWGDDYKQDDPGDTFIRYYEEKIKIDPMLYDVFYHDFDYWEKYNFETEQWERTNDIGKDYILTITESAKYRANYTKKWYKVTWLDEEGKPLLNVDKVQYKDIIDVDSKVPPHKNWDDKYHYSFDKWILKIGSFTENNGVKSDVVYIGIYNKIPHDWLPTSYEFSNDGHECTASRHCNANPEHDEIHSNIRKIMTIPVIIQGDDATCTEKGYTTYIANFEDDWNKTEPPLTIRLKDIKAKGHTWSPAHKIGRSDKDGSHYYYCLVCNYFEVEPHRWSEGQSITDNGCISEGRIKYFCTTHGCDADYSEKIEPKPHTFLPVVNEKEETCTEYGNTKYKRCSYCHLFFPENALENDKGSFDISPFLIPPKGHNYNKIIQIEKANCVEPGFVVKKCANNCGIDRIETIDPRGHKYNQGQVEYESTCVEHGREVYYCQNAYNETDYYKPCKINKYKDLPLAPHQIKIEKGEPPTCTETGTSDKRWCEVCNQVFAEHHELPPLGHSYITKTVVPPENTLRREVVYSCSRKECDHHFYFAFSD